MIIDGFVKYVKQLWKNKPDTSTPLSADRLSHIEDGIWKNSDDIEKIAAAVVSQIVNDPQKIASMAALYAVNQKVGNTAQLPSGVTDLSTAAAQLYSNLSGTYSADLNEIKNGFTFLKYDMNTLNSPFKAGATGALTAGAVLSYGFGSYANQIAMPAGTFATNKIVARTKDQGNWSDWTCAIFEADLFKIFRGTIIQTLSSPTQLTAPGFYKVEAMSADVNAGLAENISMTDYTTGDFYGLLMCANANTTNGCSYGTLIVTSPRLNSAIWVAKIWKGVFAYWSKK